MRLSTASCILLACIVTSVTSDEAVRPKRDLLYWKNLIASKLFGSSQDNTTNKAAAEPVLIREDGNVKIFRVPGFNNILVKAVPKNEVQVVQAAALIPDRPVAEDPTLAIIKSYLGTKTPDETISALEGIRNLLQSGILLKPKPLVVVPGPPKVPLIPVLPPPQPIPQPEPIFAEIVPVKPIKVAHAPVRVPSKYSYKQINNEGSVVEHSAKNSGHVVVTETNRPMPPLPPYLIERFQNMCWGMQQIPMGPPLPPIPTATIPKPVVYDVPYGPAFPYNRPTLHQYPELPAVEVKVDPYTYHHFGIPSEVLVQEPLMMPSPPPYIVDRIEKVAATAISPKVPYGPPRYSFKSINNDYIYDRNNAKIISYSNPFILQNPALFEPLNQRFVFRHVHEYPPNRKYIANVGDEPRGDVKVKVSDSSKRNEYMYPIRSNVQSTSSSSKPSYKLYYDGTATTNGYSVINNNPVLIKESSKMMPVPPRHIINRIGTAAATAHATQLPRIPAGYSFKMVNNKPYSSNGGYSKPNSIQANGIQIDTKRTEIPSSTNSYSYKLINSEGKVTTHSETNEIIKQKQLDFLTDNIKDVTVSTINPELSHPGAVMFKGPVASSYIYKQINRSNPKPFTVVPVGETATYETSAKVNIPENNRFDDPRYSSSNINESNLQENGVIDPAASSQFVFVPPVEAMDETPLPTLHRAENDKANTAKFSYKQASNNGLYNKNNNGGTIDHKREVPPTETSKTVTGERLLNNTIVTAPERDIYHKTPLPSIIRKHENAKTNVATFSYKQVSSNGVYNNNGGIVDYERKLLSPTEASKITTSERSTKTSDRDLVLKHAIEIAPVKDSYYETPLPTIHKAENGKAQIAKFSYKQVSSSGLYNNNDGSNFKREKTSEAAKTDERLTKTSDELSKHPIIVAPVKDNYLYVQNKADGSSISVRGKDGNISVKVNEVETKSTNSESFRGDIPEAAS